MKYSWKKFRIDWYESFNRASGYTKWGLWRRLMTFLSFTLYRFGWLRSAAAVSERFDCNVCRMCLKSNRKEVVLRKGMKGLRKGVYLR